MFMLLVLRVMLELFAALCWELLDHWIFVDLLDL